MKLLRYSGNKMKSKKQKLKAQCDKLFKEKIIKLAGDKCEACGSNFGITAHHFVPRSLAGHMVYYIPNGVCLCRAYHFAHHTRSESRVHATIIEKRGQSWWKDLIKKRGEKHFSYQTVQYYQDIIKQLDKIAI